MLEDKILSKELFELWIEYENGVTNEALFVKSIDKFEMLVQAFEYEKGLNFLMKRSRNQS